jgi:hypothetical protein
MKIMLKVCTTQKIYGLCYEGTVDVTIGEFNIKKRFTFSVMHPFSQLRHITIQINGRIFIEMHQDDLTRKSLSEYNDEQIAILALLLIPIEDEIKEALSLSEKPDVIFSAWRSDLTSHVCKNDTEYDVIDINDQVYEAVCRICV